MARINKDSIDPIIASINKLASILMVCDGTIGQAIILRGLVAILLDGKKTKRTKEKELASLSKSLFGYGSLTDRAFIGKGTGHDMTALVEKAASKLKEKINSVIEENYVRQ